MLIRIALAKKICLQQVAKCQWHLLSNDRSGAETDQDTLALIKYIADEGSRGPGDLGFEPTEAERRKLEKILENPSVIKTPVVRNGKQSTLGYQPEVWKGWS